MSIQAPIVKRKSEVTAYMQCTEEELSPAQLEAYGKREREYQDFLTKIESLIKNAGAVVKDKNDTVTVLQLPNGSTGSLKVTTPNHQSVFKQSGNARIIIDPRLSLLLDTSQSTFTKSGSGLITTLHRVTQNPSVNTVRNLIPTIRGATNNRGGGGGGGGEGGGGGGGSIQPTRIVSKLKTPRNSSPARPTPVAAAASSNNLPKTQVTTNTVSGTEGNTNQHKPKSTVVDLTKEAGGTARLRNYEPDSKEINFNKSTGRTFPSLVVVARPSLKIRHMTPQQISKENSYLDGKLKMVLIFSATKFTEWLIQQGLVRSEQLCATHINPDLTPVKLKLGMYSDVSKFPYSGGYVWISDCCPQRFVSVFNGSVFENAPHAPSILMKLIYHWASQTNVSNVIQWVKAVDNLYLKTFYTNLRSVCTAAVHEKFEIIGGPNKHVEVGVISLGTTTTDGNNRQVKIEVLGVMNCENEEIRLRSVDPSLDNERNYKKRFAKILEPMEKWVHKETIILTDFTVDKQTLLAMGYTYVHQVPLNPGKEGQKSRSNVNVMEYLRRVVPRLFQNTLSLLSRQLIQQFLDEVVWREKWGYVPSKAFDEIINHLAEQTELDTGDTLLARLQKIAANPFKDWSYENWKANCNDSTECVKEVPNKLTSVLRQQLRKRSATDAQLKTSTSSSPVPSTDVTNVLYLGQSELIPVEPYYYGTIPNDEHSREKEPKRKLYLKCWLCQTVVTTNFQILRHLSSHVFNESVSHQNRHFVEMPQCRYCLRSFASEVWLNIHVEEVHKKKCQFYCLICHEKFKDRLTLILHLHRNHVELEMPYKCGICGFRCSEHTVVVDHFYDVHFDSEKVQCPICLKIVSIANNGKLITQNMYFFLNHLLIHKRKLIARKCDLCLLWFEHFGLVTEHMRKDHCSFKDEPGVERYVPKHPLMMPKPQGLQTERLAATEPVTSLKCTYNLKRFSGIQINGVLKGATCSECEGDFLDKEHFPGLFSCVKCSFKTCCRRAMLDHVSHISHDRKCKKTSYFFRKSKLENELYCVCGYKSLDPDRLAEHLVKCGKGRKSAYPSAERAEECSVIDRHSVKLNKKTKDNNSKSEDEQRMLGVLGLFRKLSSEENSSEMIGTSDVEIISVESTSELGPAPEQSKESTGNPYAETVQTNGPESEEASIENEKEPQSSVVLETESMDVDAENVDEEVLNGKTKT